MDQKQNSNQILQTQFGGARKKTIRILTEGDLIEEIDNLRKDIQKHKNRFADQKAALKEASEIIEKNKEEFNELVKENKLFKNTLDVMRSDYYKSVEIRQQLSKENYQLRNLLEKKEQESQEELKLLTNVIYENTKIKKELLETKKQLENII